MATLKVPPMAIQICARAEKGCHDTVSHEGNNAAFFLNQPPNVGSLIFRGMCPYASVVAHTDNIDCSLVVAG